MKRLLNTLYVTGKNRYLSLDGENVVISDKQEEIGRIPLHNLQGIVTFGYTGASRRCGSLCRTEYRADFYVRKWKISGEGDR